MRDGRHCFGTMIYTGGGSTFGSNDHTGLATVARLDNQAHVLNLPPKLLTLHRSGEILLLHPDRFVDLGEAQAVSAGSKAEPYELQDLQILGRKQLSVPTVRL